VRQPHLADHAGQVSLPGGMLEPGERSQAAALRELAEELGVAESTPSLIGSFDPLYVFNSNFLVTPWLACLAEPPTLSPQVDEVAEVFELPLAALLDESNFARIEIQRGGLRYSAPCIRYAQYCIWGATSMILAEFRALLLCAVQPNSPGSSTQTDL
jgi:8-oxo-dGTP pyrophosphatase MutT (NUDIX family)